MSSIFVLPPEPLGACVHLVGETDPDKTFFPVRRDTPQGGELLAILREGLMRGRIERLEEAQYFQRDSKKPSEIQVLRIPIEIMDLNDPSIPQPSYFILKITIDVQKAVPRLQPGQYRVFCQYPLHEKEQLVKSIMHKAAPPPLPAQSSS